MQPNLLNIPVNQLNSPLLNKKGVQLAVLRLDEVHPIVSGNKIFKLQHYMDLARKGSASPVITFGGAYSNHLVATAYACKVENISCIGIVRGEAPVSLSHTLRNCMQYGMELQFISRQEYDSKHTEVYLQQLQQQYPNGLIIPEGGYGLAGALGAAQIMTMIPESTTHICCAVGTATTLAGLLMGAAPHQQFIGIPVLKGMRDLQDRINFLTNYKANLNRVYFAQDYHFGGYAKQKPELFEFMNGLWKTFGLPTDFVYTAKLMFGILDLIEKDFFSAGSNLLCVHSGGLQGNFSLPKNTLTF